MRALQICLWLTGIMCVLAVVGLFLPIWMLQRLAGLFSDQAFPDSTLFVYMVRVLSATYAAIGVFYILLARRPMDLGLLVPFSGLAAVFVGVVCFVTGLAVGMPLLWFLGDAAACSILGVLIVVFWRQARAAQRAAPRPPR